jgi:hypothetical protein
VRWIALWIAAWVLTLSAQASPWPAEPGATRAHSSLAFERLEGFEPDRVRLGALIEHGLADSWTLVADLQMTQADGISEPGVRVGARRSVVLGAWVAASEVTAISGAALDGAFCDADGIELRGGVGRGLGAAGFASVEVARRLRGDCTRTRVDAAVGLALTPRWQARAQVFLDRGQSDAYDKLQVSLARRFGVAEVSVGVRQGFADASDERALLVNFSWQRP